MKDERKKVAEQYFNEYPSQDVLFFTSDGQVFLMANHNDAVNHQRRIDDKIEVEPVYRKDLCDDEKAAHAAKKEAELKAEAEEKANKERKAAEEKEAKKKASDQKAADKKAAEEKAKKDKADKKAGKGKTVSIAPTVENTPEPEHTGNGDEGSDNDASEPSDSDNADTGKSE